MEGNDVFYFSDSINFYSTDTKEISTSIYPEYTDINKIDLFTLDYRHYEIGPEGLIITETEEI